jgi:hypothetical protein
MPEVVEAKVLDTGALSRSVPGGTTLPEALSGKGETPAWMFAERRSKRRNGIRIERNAASFSRLGCAVIEPCDFARKIYPIPFESKDLTRSTPSRQSESYDWPHVRRHGVKQSLRFLAPKKTYAAPRFLKHADFWHCTDPTPILVRKI